MAFSIVNPVCPYVMESSISTDFDRAAGFVQTFVTEAPNI